MTYCISFLHYQFLASKYSVLSCPCWRYTERIVEKQNITCRIWRPYIVTISQHWKIPYSIAQTYILNITQYLNNLHLHLHVHKQQWLVMFQAALEASVKLLDEYERGQLPSNITDSELWAAQKTKQAIIHPDTGEKIFMPFRMSGYIPFGSPIVSHSLGTWLLVNVCDSVWLLLFDADFDLESCLSSFVLHSLPPTN